MIQDIKGVTLRQLISVKEISKRVKELGEEITRDYREETLLLIGVLKGGFVFLADLSREIRLKTELDFIRVSSYGDSTDPGNINLRSSVNIPIERRHVLLIEDLVDTGETLKFISEWILSHGPASFKICALIDKSERRKANVRIDYTGFQLDEGFIVGYGMDYAEEGRNLPEIYVVVG